MPNMAPYQPRIRKKRILARLHETQPQHKHPQDQSNAEVILPASRSELDQRRADLQETIAAQQSESKISKAKQKRLDKYIDKKLRKDESLELIKKLEKEHEKEYDVLQSGLLLSSKKLGRVGEGRGQTRREELSRALTEMKRGIDVKKNKALLLEARTQSAADDEESMKDNGGEDDGHNRTSIGEERAEAVKAPTAFGAGLKRPLDLGEDGKPVITKRRRANTKNIVPVGAEEDTESQSGSESEWEGFSGSEDVSAIDISVQGELDVDDEVSSASGGGDEQGDLSDAVADVEESNTSELSSEGEDDDDRPSRSSAFKAWAIQQRNKALDWTPTAQDPETATLPAHERSDDPRSGSSYGTVPIKFQPRPTEVDPLPPELEHNTASDAWRQAYSVHVERTPEIQEARLALPVVAEEQKIMEAIHNNDVVVVWGATGSGKTTQLPQFLYEAGYGDSKGSTPGMIGVTQPRRVAARSMSARVGEELGDAGSRVSYQIRFESSVGKNTAIKFMTDGVLLREVSSDFALNKYSAIIVDEAHERSTNTDILIGLLTRIVGVRAKTPGLKPLKLVIMSATLRFSDFLRNSRLFRNGPPPLVQAEGRQYSVTNHFARRTYHDYTQEAFRKISRGHKKLPHGGMLVFLTGQNEIYELAKLLKDAFPSTDKAESKALNVSISADDAPLEEEDLEIGNAARESGFVEEEDDEGDAEIRGVDNEEEDIEDREFEIEEEQTEEIPKIHVLPLYSQLPTKQQLRVFEQPPKGSRLIVLATNVAETSLTIPGIRYVFDCGRAKEKKYDASTGVQSFEIGWISKASAEQRAGRAGRTGPGHCYRLYSSAIYEDHFEQYAEPEILRTPIEAIVLQLLNLKLPLPIANFPFPSPPDRDALLKAERLLSYLGATAKDEDGRNVITPQGEQLALYPLSPRLSRMLVIGLAKNSAVALLTMALVSAMALGDEMLTPQPQLSARSVQGEGPEAASNDHDMMAVETASQQLRKACNTARAELCRWDRRADFLKLLNALNGYLNSATKEHYCETFFLQAKPLSEAEQLFRQLQSVIQSRSPGIIPTAPRGVATPTKKELLLLRQIVAAGFIDNIAIRADLAPLPPASLADRPKPRRATEVPYITLMPSHATLEEEQLVFIHPSSCLSVVATKEMPDYLIYSHLSRSTTSQKVRLHPITPVSPGEMFALAYNTPLLEWQKPSKVEKRYVEEGKEKMAAICTPQLVGERAGGGEGRRQEWPLLARRVVQRKDAKKGWIVEKVL